MILLFVTFAWDETGITEWKEKKRFKPKQNQKQKIYWSTQQIIEQRITKMTKSHLVEMLNKAIIIVVVVVIIIIIIIIYNEEQRNRSKKQIFTAGSLGNLD